jgi:hypothetical protein
MATPSYKGSNQPQADSSFWSGFGSWFGGGTTPAYAGEGQPSSASSRFLGSGTPAYKSVPSGSGAPQRFAIVVPRDLIPYGDPQQ